MPCFAFLKFLLIITFSNAIAVHETKLKPGEDAILECGVPPAITLLEWTKPGLKQNVNVFVFRDGKEIKEEYPDYCDRVWLKDPKLKYGNFLVILKNVTSNDTGRYECRVLADKEGVIPELSCTINLKVEGPDHSPENSQNGGNEHSHLGFGSLLFVVGLVSLLAL